MLIKNWQKLSVQEILDFIFLIQKKEILSRNAKQAAKDISHKDWNSLEKIITSCNDL